MTASLAKKAIAKWWRSHLGLTWLWLPAAVPSTLKSATNFWQLGCDTGLAVALAEMGTPREWQHGQVGLQNARKVAVSESGRQISNTVTWLFTFWWLARACCRACQWNKILLSSLFGSTNAKTFFFYMLVCVETCLGLLPWPSNRSQNQLEWWNSTFFKKFFFIRNSIYMVKSSV